MHTRIVQHRLLYVQTKCNKNNFQKKANKYFSH